MHIPVTHILYRKNKILLTFILFILLVLPCMVLAYGVILPIPKTVEYDKNKALLGKRLFSEKRLSSDQTISCQSCHDFNFGGAQMSPVATGVYNRKGTMNAPTVFNAFFNFRQFWNGRAADLKEQAAGPIHNAVEMDMTEQKVEQVLNSDPDYIQQFKKVYGSLPITFEQVIDAIAEFEKALFTPDSKFDRYLRKEIELSKTEKDGYILFKTLGCISCHNGINVGGNSYQYLGAINPLNKDLKGDLYDISGDPFDKNRYKVPSLRNIELTAPYLHDGSKATLSEVLEIMAYHNLGLKLSKKENLLLTDFLKTLTGKKPEILQ